MNTPMRQSGITQPDNSVILDGQKWQPVWEGSNTSLWINDQCTLYVAQIVTGDKAEQVRIVPTAEMLKVVNERLMPTIFACTKSRQLLDDVRATETTRLAWLALNGQQLNRGKMPQLTNYVAASNAVSTVIGELINEFGANRVIPKRLVAV